MLGERISIRQKEMKIRTNDLLEALNITGATLSRWKNNINEPDDEAKQLLATILNTSVAYLMGESDDPRPVLRLDGTMKLDGRTIIGRGANRASTARADAAKSSGQIIRVPVYGPEAAACCGNGFGDMEPAPAAEEYIDIPAGFLGPIDPERLPFIIYASGDSMIDAGIADGSQVIINPADSVLDGDAALVDFAMNPVAHSIAVKRVYWLDGGAVEIRSACGDGWKRTFSREDADERSIRVIGKVEWVGHKPKRG